MRPCDPLTLHFVDMASLAGAPTTHTFLYTGDPWRTIISQPWIKNKLDRPFRLHQHKSTTHWQEPPQSSPLSFKQPSFAYARLPHTEVSASPLPHKWPPWDIWPLLPALSPPTQHVMAAPDPASPSPPTHWDPDSYPVEHDQGSETW